MPIDTVLDADTLPSGVYRTWCQGVRTIKPPLPDNPLARAFEIGQLLAQRAANPYEFLYDIPYLQREQELAFAALGYRPPQDNLIQMCKSA